MNTVYEVLDRGGGGIGILESPTGTVGFSLSIWLLKCRKLIRSSRGNLLVLFVLPSRGYVTSRGKDLRKG